MEVSLPRPRDSRSAEFMKLVDHLHDIITSAELPDVQVTAPVLSASQEDLVEPLPMVQSADILGLLEFVETQGGTSDLFHVASHTQVPFERVLFALGIRHAFTVTGTAVHMHLGDVPDAPRERVYGESTLEYG